ncbi:HNH endonuclease signature motif containing protein [Thiorhodococcus minor]|uniref:HNH endonuclease n=1 Tax=Thiorhodococcus minor TaxID=57489 RepID=A0A6M0K6T3_9GAMM|nr:HNH endonuclease [Thiorhodococcus minor]
MCGLGSGLIEGAHIYPVEASDSKDELWNGIALCRNHHRAFDLHRIAVHTDTWQLEIHPDLHSASQTVGSAIWAFSRTFRSRIQVFNEPLKLICKSLIF